MLGKKMADTISKMRDMKKQMAAVQKRISLIRVTASAGAGMVDVTVTGDGNVSNIKINKELFEADDVKMLEDLIISATNEALKKSKEAMAHELKSVTGGIDPTKLSEMFGGSGD
ncbi:MAG: YbaB/EbfC family nucleoid-associated protein [Leptospiraceae bacterium]|nr:YbaB/EbfC family nucleoid-associated protein [Leptospiraceae bacterium]MCP5498980.1 YbaB/EbfC family nucleoid-associated protein [Leptospiraceae bacterium]